MYVKSLQWSYVVKIVKNIDAPGFLNFFFTLFIVKATWCVSQAHALLLIVCPRLHVIYLIAL